VNAKATWKKRLTFTGTADTGFDVPLGARDAVGGDNDGFRPIELFAIGLAGCTAMDVISILQKKRQDVSDFEVKVKVDREKEHPKVFTGALIEYSVTGRDIDEKALLRAIELSSTRYCPAQAMLGKLFPITMKYQIFEDQGGNEHSVVTRGELLQPVK
jgi:putative redox protein